MKLKPGDLVFVECGTSIALQSPRCDEDCPVRGFATVIDMDDPGDYGDVAVLDSGGLKWIDPADITILYGGDQ